MNQILLDRFNAHLRAGWLPHISGGVDPAPNLEANLGSQATPTWTSVMGANHELRWAGTDSDYSTTASADWPQMTKPGSTSQVNYLWGFTADATGNGVPDNGSDAKAVAFNVSNYLQCRWNPSVSGTFASAPSLTAYPSTSHGAPTAGDGSMLGGHATDTSSKSYLKGNAYGFGFQTSVQTPAAGPSAPAVGDGSAGAYTPGTGAWGAAWQSLQGEIQYILSGGSAWDGTAAKYWYFMLALFTGPNMSTGLHVPVISTKYSYTLHKEWEDEPVYRRRPQMARLPW